VTKGKKQMMKQIPVILFLAGALAAGAAPQAEKTPKAAPKAAQKPAPKAAPKAKPAPLTPPPDAQRISEGLWRARDAQGRTWIYKQTPFGMVRYEDDAAKDAPAPAQPGIRVLEASADRVVFERRTPFGSSTWTKAPSELEDEERRALDDWRKAAKK
jgi:glucose/arabinose dehydrogenase